MGEKAKQEEVKAEVKPEEKKEEKKEEKAEEKKEEAKELSPIVLYVDLHCVGCAKKIEKSILTITGVEGIEIDMIKNQVTIKGVIDPQAVCAKIMKRTNRKTHVLSPLPASQDQKVPDLVHSQVSGMTTVELNVNMHCEACADQLKKKILKMKGVRTVTTELSSSKVMVTGTMDPNKLVDYVYRRTKKQAKIVPQPDPEPEPKPEEKKEEKAEPEPKPDEKKEEISAEKKEGESVSNAEKDGENKEELKKEDEEEHKNVINDEHAIMQRMVHYYYQPFYVMERIPPPQLFSDENPNACCIA